MLIRILALLSLLYCAVFCTPASADWKDEWEKTLRAAKQDGSVVVYTFPGHEPLFQAFQKKFPDIKVVEVTVRGSDRVTRILSERRGGKYIADVLIGGAGSAAIGFIKGGVLDPVTPALMLPEVLDTSKWWQGRHLYADEEGTRIFSFGGSPLQYFHYNTNLVKPQDFKSYWDFINTKWKGKIVIAEPLSGGTQEPLQFCYFNRELGPDFVRRFLTEMEPVVSRDIRQMVDWLAQGKVALAALQNADRLDIWQAKQQGLPVDSFITGGFREGGFVGSGGGNVMLVNRGPHPNAAKVFINWLLSREGQIAFQRLEGGKNSLRIDIPKDDVPERARILPGGKYALLEDPAYADLETVRRFVAELWKKRS